MAGIIAASTVSMLSDGAADDSNIGLRLVREGEVNSVAATASLVSMLTGEAVNDSNVGLRLVCEDASDIMFDTCSVL